MFWRGKAKYLGQRLSDHRDGLQVYRHRQFLMHMELNCENFSAFCFGGAFMEAFLEADYEHYFDTIRECIVQMHQGRL